MAQFVSALDGIGKQGVEVSRFNLSYQPAAFAENTAVREALDSDGLDCLPLVMVDGEIVSKGVYLSRQELFKVVGLEPESEEPAAQKSGCC